MSLLLAVVLSQTLPIDHPGYQQLLNGSVLECGVPLALWRRVPVPHEPSFPGRTGLNASLEDTMTATVGRTGVPLAAPNCLECHAGKLRGRRVLGLGNSFVDQTTDLSGAVQLARGFLPDSKARQEVDRFLRPLQAVAPFVRTDTLGVSSADDLAVTLMAHRDPRTLAWRAPKPALAASSPVPVDVPAWWLARDKRRIFATGIGTGSRATLMASASLLCTDSPKSAERIIAAFAPVPDFVDTLEPPRWPWPVDRPLADEGKRVFNEHCEGCHLWAEVIPVDRVGTDPLLWQRTVHDAESRLEWFNASVYGKTAHLEPTEGYVAQPLRGVWATAPYFHNGSVPTLAAVIDSRKRPVRWSRSGDSNDYDEQQVGWRFTEEASRWGSAVYDTTRPGFGRQGHLYGDALSEGERTALLEFLKTL